MENVLKFIKEHKILTTLIIMLIIFIILFIILYNVLFVYNDDNRLNGKKEVEISDKNQIVESIKKYDNVEDAKINIVTKEITIIVDVTKDLQKDKAKEIANKILDEFDDTEKEYYDIQIMATCKKCAADDDTYPIIGYKNNSNDKIVWSNN